MKCDAVGSGFLWSLLALLTWSHIGRCYYEMQFLYETKNLSILWCPVIISKPVAYIVGIQGISLQLTKSVFYFSGQCTTVWIQNSVLDLYDEQDLPIEANRCNENYFANLTINIFSNMEEKQLLIDLNSVSFKRPICPYLFKNANIQTLSLSHYGQTKFYDNKLRLYDIENSNSTRRDFNASIQFLDFERIYRHTFKRAELSLLLFSDVTGFYFYGDMPFFENDFFLDFKLFNILHLDLIKVGEYFQASTNKWLSNIFAARPNFESREEMIQLTFSQSKEILANLEVSSRQNLPDLVYYFPDEDFCLFKFYPYKKFVFTMIRMLELNNTSYSNSNRTSCLYRFLAQYNLISIPFINAANISTPDAALFDDYLLLECEFAERLAICFNTTDPEHWSKLKPIVSFYDIEYALKWIEYLGPIITFPIFSALGFVLNLLIIMVIRSKKNKKEKLFVNKSFRLIEMNSAFNCAECFIYMFKMMGLCIGQNSIFCSSLRGTKFQLYFGTMNIYLSETMKSCSMMTGLLFSLQRYIDTSKIRSKMLLRFSKFSALKLFIFTLFYGFVFSVPVLFDVNFQHSSLDAYDFPGIFWLNKDMLEPSSMLISLYFLHYILNNFLILMINLIVDCFLVREIKSNLRQKAANKKKMEEENNEPNRNEKKRASVERKANNMIIVSVIIYIFCRIPELVGVFVLYTNPETQSSYIGSYGTFCMLNLICYLVSDSIEYLYMLSYSFNLLIYFKFNTNFNKGFRNFFGIKTAKNK